MAAEAFTIRLAVLADLGQLDTIQLPMTRQVGFFRTKWLETAITKGEVLVALEGSYVVGYCLSKPRSRFSPACGLFYQVAIREAQRGKGIARGLVEEAIRRMPATVHFVGCWVASDLPAADFWEALGFRAKAWRLGALKSERVHIFFQKAIREGVTWEEGPVPTVTSGGILRGRRIVTPLDPGQDWRTITFPTDLETQQRLAPSAAVGVVAAAMVLAVPIEYWKAPLGKVGIIVGGRIRYIKSYLHPTD